VARAVTRRSTKGTKIHDAPKFDIICKPNDWARTVKDTTTGNRELTETRLQQLEFWTQFKEYAQNHQTKLRIRKPSPQHYTDIGIGYSNAYLSLTLSSREAGFGVTLYIPNNKELYERLLAH